MFWATHFKLLGYFRPPRLATLVCCFSPLNKFSFLTFEPSKCHFFGTLFLVQFIFDTKANVDTSELLIKVNILFLCTIGNDSRGPGFESKQQQYFFYGQLYRKDENKERISQQKKFYKIYKAITGLFFVYFRCSQAIYPQNKTVHYGGI